MSENPDRHSETTRASADYARGFEDGTGAASDEIAKFFHALKAEHAKAVADMQTAQSVMEGLILQRLAPLQEKVRRLKL